jgi:C1A family cysteine protease
MKRLILAAVAALALVSTAHAGTVATVVGKDGQAHFTGYLGPQKQLLSGEQKRYFTPSAEEMLDVPDHYDAREDGYVADIVDQGQCGSCWDFSMTKTLASARMASGQTQLDLAEQDPLVNAKAHYGCDGGFMDAGYWVEHGLAKETDCPYKASDRVACSKPAADKGLAWGFVGKEGERRLKTS